MVVEPVVTAKFTVPGTEGFWFHSKVLNAKVTPTTEITRTTAKTAAAITSFLFNFSPPDFFGLFDSLLVRLGFGSKKIRSA